MNATNSTLPNNDCFLKPISMDFPELEIDLTTFIGIEYQIENAVDEL